MPTDYNHDPDPEFHEHEAGRLAALAERMGHEGASAACATTAVAHATLALSLRQRLDQAPGLGLAEADPCGSQRVLRWVEGHQAEVVWCSRRSGPCPYPGSDDVPDVRPDPAPVFGEPHPGWTNRPCAVEEADPS